MILKILDHLILSLADTELQSSRLQNSLENMKFVGGGGGGGGGR